MQPLLRYISDLFWRARVPTRDGPSFGLSVGIAVSMAEPPQHTSAHDMLLYADGPEEAQSYIHHLFDLGTVGRVQLYGLRGVPPAERRRLERCGRVHRGMGLDIYWSVEGE